MSHIGQSVTLAGWVAKRRDLGSLTFVDLRDRYGITQLSFNEVYNTQLLEEARKLGREFVIQAEGKVTERSNKNTKIPTGEIEIIVEKLSILNTSLTPPFTIEEETDGGDDIRMQYRYLDLRRDNVRKSLMLRHQVARHTRQYLDMQDFIEVETPVLIKSTPEGARDFVVPSRMNPGQFYALPQSPQTFKQLLMVSGFDRYYQIVKCFRDEDLRADRQPEFTQIDCEMSFVEQEDILNLFEGLVQHLFREVKGVEIGTLPRMTFDEAMHRYGNDKPDIRFEMEFKYLKRAISDNLDIVQLGETSTYLIRVSGKYFIDENEIKKLVEIAKSNDNLDLEFYKLENEKVESLIGLSIASQEKFERMLYKKDGAFRKNKHFFIFGTLPLGTFEKFEKLRKDIKELVRPSITEGKNFNVFDAAPCVLAICAKGCGSYTRKQLDELTEWVKRPQIGAKGLVYVFCNADGSYKSSVDKFYSQDDLEKWANLCGAEKGDLLLVLSGETKAVQKQMSELRLEMGRRISKSFKFDIVKRDRRNNIEKDLNFYTIRIDGKLKFNESQLIRRIKESSDQFVDLKIYKLDKSITNLITNVEPDLEDIGIMKYTQNNKIRTKKHYFVFITLKKGTFENLKKFRDDLKEIVAPMGKSNFKALWVLDFPLLEQDDESGKWHAMHHPFTSPKPEDIDKLETDPGAIRANAYDMVINGTEVGGGSIRIYNKELQGRMFKRLGFTDEEAMNQFGFLMNAFEYGAPPHGGIAFGFDRLCSIFGGADGIRDFIAFPKNNQGRDMMIDAPSAIDDKQLDELKIRLKA